MGEAKRRFEARASGRAWAMHKACPTCRSPRVRVERGPKTALSQIETDYGVCLDCSALWEAYPADWREDVVCAEPCDNCAFRPGSDEVKDRAAWRELLDTLRDGHTFHCHKGAPILMSQDALEFDADWIKTRGRKCAGFLRVMQSWPDWLERRYGAPATAGSEGEP